MSHPSRARRRTLVLCGLLGPLFVALSVGSAVAGQSTPPGTATLVSPIGTTSPANPTFTWNAVSGATHYNLYISDATGKRFERWYERSLVGCPSGTGTCTITPEVPMTPGTVSWWIQTWNASGGYGTWSTAGSWTLQTLSAPTLVAPSGYAAKPSFQFRWNAVPGATHHYLRVVDGAGTTQVQTWYTVAETTCAGGGICSISVSPTLAAGAASWSIQPWNVSAGYGPWSSTMTFTPVDPLATPTLVAPVGSYMAMPSIQFQWNAVPGATDHYLWVTDASGTIRVQTWYSLSATNCASGGTCSITLSPTLSPGTATWWIQARNSQVMSAWSAPMTFTPNVPLSTPTLIAPTGTYTALPAIQFRWNAVPGASEHRVWITDGAGATQDAWYSTAATNCPTGGVCSLTLTPTLGAGAATWWVMARNVSVASGWSTPMTFTPVVTPPSLGVASGTYATDQLVSVTTPYSGATTRYTTTGVAPTVSDPTVPLTGVVVDRSLTLCVRTWLAGQAPSAVTCGSYTLQAQPAVFTPAGGSYTATQAVTVESPTANTTVRYTTDGTEPTESSPAFPTALTVSSSVTLKAKAFRAGWLASATTTAAFNVQVPVPTITTRQWPTPNSQGWNNSDVTVSFYCAGATSCPEPVTVSEEGVDLLVSRTVVNAAGIERTATVTLNIDKTPPVLEIHSPVDHLNTSNAAVTLISTVTDALSGLNRLTCNGVPVAITGSQNTCDVALTPGRTSAVLHAIDDAGNSASQGRTIIRHGIGTSLQITPALATVRVGDQIGLYVVDEYGQRVTAAWSSDNESIVFVTDSNNGLFSVNAAGVATISATANGLTASLELTAVSDTATVVGFTRWSIPVTVGVSPWGVLPTQRHGVGIPDFFAVDTVPSPGTGFTLRAMGANAEVLWAESGTGQPLFADSFGGIIAMSSNNGLVRLAAPPGSTPWSYEAPGLIVSPAQAADGTIYALETNAVSWNGEVHLVAIDGSSGVAMARVKLPTSTMTDDGACPAAAGRSVANHWPTAPVVSNRGTALVQIMVTHTANHWPDCSGIGSMDVYRGLHLVEVARDGSSNVRVVHEYDYSGPSQAYHPYPATGHIVPGETSDLVVWSLGHDGPGSPTTLHLTRASADVLASTTLPADSEVALAGDGGRVFLTTPSATVAFDTTSGTVAWSVAGAAAPVMALNDGGVALHDPVVGSITAYSENGAAVASGPLPLLNPTSSLSLGVWLGIDPADGIAKAMSGLELSEAQFSFQRGRGNVQRQNAARTHYGSPDEAAIAVLKRFNLISIERNREYGGRICKVSNQKYLWSVPNVNLQFSDTVVESPCEDGLPWVGKYHTHGRIGNNGFSSQDINNADLNPGKIWYVATPCGYIDKYVGPNSAIYVELLKMETPIVCIPRR